MYWIKSDSAKDGAAPADTKNVQAVKMNGSEWQESIDKLAGDFGSTKAGRARPPGAPGRGRTPRHSEVATKNVVATALRRRVGGDQPDTDARAQIKTGLLSPLQEDDAHYYAVAVMKKSKDRLKLATVAWLKKPLRSWLAKVEAQVPVTMATVSANYTLPMITSPSGGCTDDTWTPTTTTNAPDARSDHTAVWTGSEMIVWGGSAGPPYFNTGGRYNPSTDSWTATSTSSAPAGRLFHTAIWTGSEMIVWGGFNGSFLDTGGRYNPNNDSWTTTSTTNAPSARA
jgi:hypothetical protein